MSVKHSSRHSPFFTSPTSTAWTSVATLGYAYVAILHEYRFNREMMIAKDQLLTGLTGSM
jgi:hypothetical protein